MTRESQTIGQKIRQAREAAGLTQVEVGAQCNPPCGQGDVSKIEHHGKYAKAWQQIENLRRILNMK